ncbi:MAG: GumC family protein [Dysgonomonas sp.]
MSQETKESKEFIDLSETFFHFLKYWKWFIASVIIFGAATFFYLKTQQAVYHNIANILIKTEDSKSSSMGSMAMKSLGIGGLSASENIEDEVNIISSHSLMRKMIKELGLNVTYTLKKFPADKSLYNDSPITFTFPEEFQDTLSNPLSFKIKKDKATEIEIKYGKHKLKKHSLDKLPAIINTELGNITVNFHNESELASKKKFEIESWILGYDYAAEFFMKNISVGTVSKKSNVISLSVEEVNINRGKDILNKLIFLYNTDALDEKNKAAKNTVLFIDEQIKIISKDLASIESNIEQYKKLNNVINIGTETGLFLNKMSTLKDKSIEMDIQLSLIDMLSEYVNDPKNRYSLIPTSAILNQNLGGAINEYNTVIMERFKLLENTKENNPLVISLNNQIDRIRNNVTISIENAKKEINHAKKDWDKIQGEIETRASNIPKQEREFVDMNRQQLLKSQLYVFLLEKQQEAELSLASNTPKAKIIDAAYTLTKPVSPRKFMTLAIGLLIGLIVPVIVIIIKDTFKFKLSNLEELERNVKIPILGEICKDKSGNKIVVSDTSTSSIVELFRLVRTNLQFVLTNKSDKVILITSSISGEGKSFVAVNLALSLSLIKNKKVVIVGLDIRNPKLSDYFSLDNKKGITTYLSSEEYKPEDVIVNEPSNLKNISVVMAGPVPPNPSELLLSDRLDEFFEYLRANYDYIIVDTAPVGMVSDTFSLARISDATIYVYRANYTNKSHLKLINTIQKNDKLKKNILGNERHFDSNRIRVRIWE